LVQPLNPLREQKYEKSVEIRTLAAQPIELCPSQRQGLAPVQGGHRGCSLSSRPGQGKLAEALTLAENGNRDRFSRRGGHMCRDVATDDQMQRVRRITLMEHDFAAAISPSPQC
jgi:hypothetical protein